MTEDVLAKLQITTQDQRMDFNPRILESPGMVVWEDNAIEYRNELYQNTQTPRLHGFSRYIRKCGKGQYGSKCGIYCPTRLFRFGNVLMALEFPCDYFSFLKYLASSYIPGTFTQIALGTFVYSKVPMCYQWYIWLINIQLIKLLQVILPGLIDKLSSTMLNLLSY